MTPEEEEEEKILSKLIYMGLYYLANIDKRKEYLKLNETKIKADVLKRSKEYYLKNKIIINIKKKEYTKKNELIISKYQQEYRKANSTKNKNYLKIYYRNNKPALRKKQKIYVAKNRPMINKNRKKRKETDILFRLACNARSCISTIMREKRHVKTSKLNEIIGCDISFYRQYIENQFEPWMNWDNYGKYQRDTFNFGWDIDHIVPLCSAKTYEELINLLKYTNTRPLCSQVNRVVKRDTISL